MSIVFNRSSVPSSFCRYYTLVDRNLRRGRRRSLNEAVKVLLLVLDSRNRISRLGRCVRIPKRIVPVNKKRIHI